MTSTPPTTTKEAIIEKMARGMCIASGHNPDEVIYQGAAGLPDILKWHDWRHEARIAYEAALPLLREKHFEEAAGIADKQELYPASGWSANDADFWECGCADMQRAIATAIRADALPKPPIRAPPQGG